MISVITRKITAFILVFILFAHSINTLAIIGDFIVNQDFIAKTLCIEKADQKGCNGKCQLRKELSKENSNTSENPLQESKRMTLDVFCLISISTYDIQLTASSLLKQKITFKIPIFNKMYLDIDTPPPNFS